MVIPVLQNSSQAVAQSRTVSEASAQTATLSVDSERTNKVRADASREAAPGTSTVPAASGSTTDLLSRLGLDKSVPDRLIELGPKAYGQVLDVLKSDGNEARLLAAVETARKSSHDSFVEPLFGLLKVSDKPEVREACAEALTDLMKNCSCDEEERALLKSLLTAPEGSASLKRSVLSLLITTGEEQVLLDATLDPVLEEEHRISAASGLAELGMSRQSISSLAKELQNPALTPGMQNALAGALTAYSPSVAFKTAMQAFESPEVNEERSLGAALVLSYMEAQGMLTEEWVAEVGCQIEKIMQSPAASLLSDALLSRVLAPMGRQYAGDLLRSWVLSNSGSDPVDSAVRALHQIDPEAGSELLTELAVNPGNQFYQRIEALKLMAERPTEANRAILLAGMRDPQVMTYSLPAVIGNLSEAGGPVATSLLRELLADPAMTHNLRSQAMRGLSVCGQPSDFELIRSFARDNTTFFYDVHNLIESADTMLNRHGNNIPGITEALRETLALEAADRFQQLALRAMLLRLGEKDVLPGLRKQLLEDEFACRATYAAVAALGAERDASSIYTLNRLASDPARASDVRLEAIIAVGELPEKECREILRPLLRDPIESLRLEAAAILWRRDTDEAAMKVLGEVCAEAAVSQESYKRAFAAICMNPTPGITGAIRRLHNNPERAWSRHVTEQLLDEALVNAGKTGQYVESLHKLADAGPRKEAKAIHAAAEVYKNAIALGIEHPGRFSEATLAEIVRNRQELPADDKRPVALVILAKDDENGAFYQDFAAYDDLAKGYRLLVFEAGSDKEVLEIMRGHGTRPEADRAELLLLGGHGDRGSITFGAGQNADGTSSDAALLDLGDEAELRAAGVGAAVKDGGRVVLYSCSTGQGEDDPVAGVNMVNMTRRLIPHAGQRMIVAPTVPVSQMEFKLDEKKSVIGLQFSGEQYQAELRRGPLARAA